MGIYILRGLDVLRRKNRYRIPDQMMLCRTDKDMWRALEYSGGSNCRTAPYVILGEIYINLSIAAKSINS